MSQGINRAAPEAPQFKIIQSIVTHLKEYPFLLISIAAMVVLTFTLAFELEKIKEFSPLLYGAVFLPLVMQFYIEVAKRRERHQKELLQQQAGLEPPGVAPQPAAVAGAALNYSRKAISSFTIIILTLISYGDMSEAELLDPDMQLGFFILSVAATWLAISALGDIKKNMAKGKTLAIISIVLSVFCALGSLGYYLEASGM